MKTIEALIKQFQTEDSCNAFLTEIRWPKSVQCLRCDRLMP